MIKEKDLIELGFEKKGNQYIKIIDDYIGKKKINIKFIYLNNTLTIKKTYKGLEVGSHYYEGFNLFTLKSLIRTKYVGALIGNLNEKQDIERDIKIIDFYRQLKKRVGFINLRAEAGFMIYFKDTIVADTDKLSVMAYIELKRLAKQVVNLDIFLDVYERFFKEIDEMLDRGKYEDTTEYTDIFGGYMNFVIKYKIKKNKESDLDKRIRAEADKIITKLRKEVDKLIRVEQLKQKI